MRLRAPREATLLQFPGPRFIAPAPVRVTCGKMALSLRAAGSLATVAGNQGESNLAAKRFYKSLYLSVRGVRDKDE